MCSDDDIMHGAEWSHPSLVLLPSGGREGGDIGDCVVTIKM